jgi:hypothetical protein
MPGHSATVGEQIETLRRVAGKQAVRLIRREPDEPIMRIVQTYTQVDHKTGAAANNPVADPSPAQRISEADASCGAGRWVRGPISTVPECSLPAVR